MTSRPPRQRWKRGEDRFDVAAGLEAEHGAAVVEQIELRVAAAAHELLVAVGLAPGQREVAAHDLGIDAQKRPADILREGEGGIPAALRIPRRQVVVKNATHAARLLAVRRIEVLLAPSLVAGIVRYGVRPARNLHGTVEGDRVGVGLRASVVEHGSEVAAAAEPP